MIRSVTQTNFDVFRNDRYRAAEDQHDLEETEWRDEELQHGEEQGEGGGAEGGSGSDPRRNQDTPEDQWG